MKSNRCSQFLFASVWMAMLQVTTLSAAQVQDESSRATSPDAPTQEATGSRSDPPTEAQSGTGADPAADLQAATTNAPQPTERAAMIRHLPLNDSLVEDVRFVFDVNAPDYAGTIVVRAMSRAGSSADAPDQAVQELEATLIGTKYVAVLSQAEVVPPGFSYYVVERMADGSERPVFADAATPHVVRVTLTDAEETQQRRAREHDDLRSTVLLSGEAVDYGDRRLGNDERQFHDRYYKLEIGYAYSFFTTIEDVRISLVRVRGQAAVFEAWTEPRAREIALGIDYGRAAVTVVALEQLRLRGAMLLGASQRGFEYGVGASLMIGNPLGSNIDLGTEVLTTLGAVTHLRLGFLATPRIPMGAAVEVSTFPVGEDAGVRLLYDVGYRFNPVTAVTLRGGYQARTSVTGGASLALNVNYGF